VLPVTDVTLILNDKSAEVRSKTAKGWQRAVARRWIIKTFPGTHVAMTEDPRRVTTLSEQPARSDRHEPVGP